MSDLLLTDQERKRFVEYCLREAKTLTGLLEQMQKLSVPLALVNDHRIRIAAYTRVARDLMSVETMTVSGSGVKGTDMT